MVALQKGDCLETVTPRFLQFSRSSDMILVRKLDIFDTSPRLSKASFLKKEIPTTIIVNTQSSFSLTSLMSSTCCYLTVHVCDQVFLRYFPRQWKASKSWRGVWNRVSNDVKCHLFDSQSLRDGTTIKRGEEIESLWEIPYNFTYYYTLLAPFKPILRTCHCWPIQWHKLVGSSGGTPSKTMTIVWLLLILQRGFKANGAKDWRSIFRGEIYLLFSSLMRSFRI